VASIRKRKVPKYSAGGAVPRSDAPPPAVPPPIVDDTPDDEASAAILRAYRATLHAEELNRAAQRIVHQQQEARTVDEDIDSMPGLSEPKRAFLKAHPDLTSREKGPIVQQRYVEAIRSGIVDDSPEMYDFILTGVRREDDGKFVANEPMPEIERRPLPPLPSPSIRKSMPISAPVSREIPTFSGRRHSATQQTLSAEEVRIAHNSFSDPRMSNVEKEKLYLTNKLKLQQMRENGEYSDQTRG
jgi:hypothetical protein